MEPNSPSHQPSNAAAGTTTTTTSSAFPTHQKNSTWDAFMWSSKLQLPALDSVGGSENGGVSSSGGPMPTHRRGASMPPNLDDDDGGLPPIRYDDLVPGRPRLGHRTRGTFNSMGGESDWTNSSGSGQQTFDILDSAGVKNNNSGSNSNSNSSSFDRGLVAEPPPTHRRGGSNPMLNTSTLLGGLDLYGSEGLFSSSSSMNAVSTSAPNSARPQHRRSVTFQGTTSSHTSDLFDFDALKLDANTVGGSIKRSATPPRMSTPPPASVSIHSSSVPASQQLPLPPPIASAPLSTPMMSTATIAPTPMSVGVGGPILMHPSMGMFPSGAMGYTAPPPQMNHHHQDMYGDHHYMGGDRAPALDPTMQLQLQMQQALIVQQQQWLLAMQQQQLQQQQQQQQQRGRIQPTGAGVIPGTAGAFYPASPQPVGHNPMAGGRHAPMSPPYGPATTGVSSTTGTHSPSVRPYHGGGGKGHPNAGGPSGSGANHHHTSQSNGGAGGAGANHVNDPVLSEYKTTGLRPKIEDLKGHVLAFATDAHGSRFLQYQMEIARPEDKDMLVDESVPVAVALMQDTFGNYVIQNFLEHATSQSRRKLAQTMKGYMLQLSIQPHGCRVVQRALDLVDIDQRNELLEELLVAKGNVFQAARNTHATHVLQKTVSILRRDAAAEASGNERLKGSIDLMRAMEKAVADDVVQLLLHPHAYRLVLNVLGDCDPNRSVHVARAVDTVAESRDQLSVDQHGNFMLQHMLENKQADGVLDFVRDRLVELSQHKFGSHLVEKCFAVANPDRCTQLVEELLRPTSERNIAATKKLKSQQGDGGAEWGDAASPALALMKDPYANFVVQKAFDRVQPGPLKSELMSLVQEKAELLQKFTYGRHILAHVMSSRQQPSYSSGSGSASPQAHQQNSGASSPSRSPSGSPPRGYYPKNGPAGRGPAIASAATKG